MAIGNAPWPIGVTMVGIHARTGREKIFSQQIAHVLNDETQRKYIQVMTVDCTVPPNVCVCNSQLQNTMSLIIQDSVLCTLVSQAFCKRFSPDYIHLSGMFCYSLGQSCPGS